MNTFGVGRSDSASWGLPPALRATALCCQSFIN
jgi:hypothetical protein